MLKRDEVLKRLDAYDIQKYPASVYDELVVEQRPYPGRIKILGAWKTGCLRAGGQGREYVGEPPPGQARGIRPPSTQHPS
ncbi:hypothetical protein SAMN02745219_00611 [Desulfofundulus thermosubterraneus DSM 16057]|uniref:Uncharacterized protein n=1 Tax=Desulfofundulus thermosubterraneus DSM 16057 TaxID=1121432 RepID=A0A1M6C6E0_9FIRM|nr:hypothetical protein SAMN02745219_00611 [Desulfofundulus thermosubterraneus DSM 16057]